MGGGKGISANFNFSKKLQTMKVYLRHKVGPAAIAILLISTLGLTAMQCQQRTAPAQENASASGQVASAADPKAGEVISRVMQQMGGKKAWDQVRYVAWSFAGSYQIWDKHANTYRYEKDSIVAVTNLDTQEGKAYIHGKEVTGTEAGKKILERMYPAWANNSYWLIMPFKLADPGVTVRHVGEGQTEAGEPADFLELTFKEVGVTPQNKYVIAVDKERGLVTQWAFYRNASDPSPTFTRPWYDYRSYGPVLLSTGRHPNPEEAINIRHLAVTNSLPAALFNSPTPIDKSQVK
jgi:hypothetical protein